MRMQIQKWDSSLALRIPKPCAEAADVQEGTIVDLSVSNGQCVVAPVRHRKAMSLEY
jgi:antitoxin component of MazEF toxin-antitoxin module